MVGDETGEEVGATMQSLESCADDFDINLQSKWK